jgi:hypothetical protein
VAKVLDAGDELFFLNLIANSPKAAARFPAQELHPRLRRGSLEDAGAGEKTCRWQAAYDFRRVPVGEPVDLIVEYYDPGDYLRRGEGGATLPVAVRTPTAEFTLWILLPTGKQYKSWRVTRHKEGNPNNVERVHVVTEYLADDYTILAFKLLSLRPDDVYEVQWFYK